MRILLSLFAAFLFLSASIAPPATSAGAARTGTRLSASTTAKASGKATAAPASGTRTALKTVIRSGRHPDLKWPAFAEFRGELERLYEPGGWQPLWSDGRRPSDAAQKLIERLLAAETLGLDPADYDAVWLKNTAARLAKQHGSPPEQLQRFDLALSVAAVRFVTALDCGRVNPRTLTDEVLTPVCRDPAPIVDSLRVAKQQSAVLERIEPRFRHYQLLKTSLARYRELASDATVAPVTDLPRDVKPGMALRAAPRLRRLLAATGDLSRGNRPKPAADTLYSADLVQAVKRFQRRMGLLPDGVIWFQTAEELARPFEHRIRQIELALERWRWMPPSFDTPPVLVNLPAFRLYALRGPVDREQDILAMDVLAGSANSHETPSFTAEMTHVVFRPFWNPPLEIMTDELGTRALWDRENLESHGYVLVESDADDAPVLPMTPENLARVGKNLRIRQRPGPQNALGLVKFMLPNPHEIYLHDTPAKGLFAMSRRDYSHGCIRVSEPVALAELLLEQQPGWDKNRIREAMENGPDNVRVDLERPVPVYVLYATAAAAENGEVYFYSDVYGRDAELDALLRKGYPYPKTELRAELRTAAEADQGRISTDVPSGTTR